MKTVIILLVLFLLPTNVVLSEPTPTIKYLMNEKASLFDLGIFKLDMRFQAFCNSHTYLIKSILPELSFTYSPSTSIVYEWNDNRILMSMSICLTSEISHDKLQAVTRKLFELIRIDMGVNPDKGIDLSSDSVPEILEMFYPRGYRKVNDPHIFPNQLKNIIDINLDFHTEPPTKAFYKCKGKLYSTEVLCSK